MLVLATGLLFGIADSSFINADLSTIADNTGYDAVVVVNVGTKDGSRFQENAFVRNNVLYVTEDYYKDNLGSPLCTHQRVCQSKIG